MKKLNNISCFRPLNSKIFCLNNYIFAWKEENSAKISKNLARSENNFVDRLK